MSTTIRDASQTTRERKQKVLAAWRRGDAFVGTKPLTVYPEQGISTGGQGYGPSSTVAVDAKIGVGICDGCGGNELRGNPGAGVCSIRY
jgi:hypothetical protein